MSVNAALIALLESGKPLDHDDEAKLIAALVGADRLIEAASPITETLETPRSRKGMDALMKLDEALALAKMGR